MATIDFFNNGSVAVTDVSTEILAASDGNHRRGATFIVNAGSNDCFLSFGADAVAGQGALLKAFGGSIGLEASDGWSGTVNGICASGKSTTITFSEGVDA